MILSNVVLTAYCACKLCCGHANQPTASGRMPVVGRTLAGPTSFPLGTRAVIPSLGTNVFIIEDRTAKRFNGRFDLYLSSHQQAKQFGKKIVNIKIEE